MKKLFAIICIVGILFSCNAIADERLPEIRFRDLELGTTAAEVFSSLGEMNPHISYGESYGSYIPKNAAECGRVRDNNEHNKQAIMIYNLQNNELAGHECCATCLYFVKPVIDGKLADEKDGIFYAGTYALDISAKDDILAKLTELYGKPEKGKHNKKECYTWYGDNNTAIYMTRGSSIVNLLGISYAWLGFDEVFEETCAYLDAQPDTSINSTSGL